MYIAGRGGKNCEIWNIGEKKNGENDSTAVNKELSERQPSWKSHWRRKEKFKFWLYSGLMSSIWRRSLDSYMILSLY